MLPSRIFSVADAIANDARFDGSLVTTRRLALGLQMLLDPDCFMSSSELMTAHDSQVARVDYPKCRCKLLDFDGTQLRETDF